MLMLSMGGVTRPDAGPPLGALHEGHWSQDKGRCMGSDCGHNALAEGSRANRGEGAESVNM